MINNGLAVYFNFNSSLHFLDPTDDGIDISPFIHAGTNSFQARAWDNISDADYGLTPLRITVPTSQRYRVTFSPDTIEYSDSTRITAIAVDLNGNPVVISDETILTFTMIRGATNWGYFYDPSGNFAISPLQNVRYGDARMGRVLFVANGFIDTVGGLTPVQIRVEGGLRVGLGTTYLGTVTLKFDGADTMAVYPNYPKNNNSTDKRDTLDLTLRSRWGGSTIPAQNVPVKIGRPALVDSGGHSHGGTRPLGKYRFKSGTTWNIVDSLQQSTDASGTLLLKFLASQFGGIERVRAQKVRHTNLGPDRSAYKKAWTKVANLHAIHSGQNNFITFTSETGAVYHRLTNSDWGTDSTRLAIDSAVTRYAKGLGLVDTCYLAVIDMSLPSGGRFDLLGRWESSTSHSWHRQGRSVDFGPLYMNSRGGSTWGSILRDGRVRKISTTIDDFILDQKFKALGLKRKEKNLKPKPKIHYEMLPEPK